MKDSNKTVEKNMSFNGNKIKAKIYDLTVKFHKPSNKPSSVRRRKIKELIFVIGMTIIPVIQFLIFYFGVNINSILLAFKEYDANGGGYSFVGLQNFKKVIDDFIHNPNMMQIGLNSLILYACTLFIGFPLNLVFAFVVYKKIPLAGFFRVVLYLPQIISSLVISLMFMYFVDKGVLSLLKTWGIYNKASLIADPQLGFPILIFYSIWSSFGTAIIIYTNSMSAISKSITEYSRLEGVGMFKEFIHITLPMIYPSIVTFFVVGVAGIFINQAAAFNFFGTGLTAPNMQTLGYYFFVMIARADASIASYPYASAAGLLFTFVAAPITLLVKYLLERFGPSA